MFLALESALSLLDSKSVEEDMLEEEAKQRPAVAHNSVQRRCVLECVAPEGSPLESAFAFVARPHSRTHSRHYAVSCCILYIAMQE